MEKNYLKYSCILTLALLALLLMMHLLPTIVIGGHIMRQVDLLGEVREKNDTIEVADTLLPPVPKVKPAFVDTCRTGLTCIEDYSDSTLRGMTPYYKAIDALLQSPPQQVRIAVFGDSFIEADILTADLRSLLQSKYGGCGVGFVPITSATPGFRPTVRHSFSGWRSHSITDSVYFDREKQGISGQYFIPTRGAYAELRGQTKYASHLDTCQQATIYFRTNDSVTISVRVNGDNRQTDTFDASNNLRKMQVKGKIGRVRWTVDEAGSTLFYGMAMDGVQGIVLDNYSQRSSTGLRLSTIPKWMLDDFNDLRPYHLIILQYGLNVATTRGRNYDKYAEGMKNTINYLKDRFPQAGILVVGVSDRNYNDDDGELRTMPGVKNLIRYQQNLAADCGVAFWNMFEAMGGEGSMAELVEAKPAMANRDYSHINFRGGKHLAAMLYEALEYGKEQFDRRCKYEEE